MEKEKMKRRNRWRQKKKKDYGRGKRDKRQKKINIVLQVSTLKFLRKLLLMLYNLVLVFSCHV